MRVYFTVLILSLFCFAKVSGMNISLVTEDTVSLPKVFVLGQHEKAYEKLYAKHSTVLLEVCNDDMDVAFDKWLGMLEEMEDYANSIDYDIKGIKVWLNVFWDKNGKIKHIAYHLKVNSRNVQLDELTAFFSSFMNHYTFPSISQQNFSHYGSASFPTFARRIKSNKDIESANTKQKRSLPKSGVGSKY